MAEFLQDTIEEISVTADPTKPNKKLIEFSDFVTKVSMGLLFIINFIL